MLDKFVADIVKTDDANDVLYALEASRDYDPGPGLEKIRAPLLAINSADDLINPPELGILEREIKRVPHGRAVVIPLSDKTRGHGSHTIAALWKDELRRARAVEAAAVAAARARAAPGPAGTGGKGTGGSGTGVTVNLGATRQTIQGFGLNTALSGAVPNWEASPAPLLAAGLGSPSCVSQCNRTAACRGFPAGQLQREGHRVALDGARHCKDNNNTKGGHL